MAATQTAASRRANINKLPIYDANMISIHSPSMDMSFSNDHLGNIDPDLLPYPSPRSEPFQGNWGNTLMPNMPIMTTDRRVEQSPTFPIFGTSINSGMSDVFSQISGSFGRPNSPYSMQSSSSYSIDHSPSMGSEVYNEAVYDPTTPPDVAQSALFPVAGSYWEEPQRLQASALGFVAAAPQSNNSYTESYGVNTNQVSGFEEKNYILSYEPDHSFGFSGVNTYPYDRAITVSPFQDSSVECGAGMHAISEETEGKDESCLPVLESRNTSVCRKADENFLNETYMRRNPTSKSKHTLPSPATSPIIKRLRVGRPRRVESSTKAVSTRAISKHAVPSTDQKRRKKLLAASGNHNTCAKCKATFNDAKSLEEHVTHIHPRPYICVFHFAGCTARFDAKNEWKRHVITQHLVLNYWLCTEGSCAETTGPTTQARSPSLPVFGSIFNRKDLYSQHVKRMHSQDACIGHQSAPENNERLRRLQDGAQQERCHPPTYLRCPVMHCTGEFHGTGAWNDRMEHVAQQHLENSAVGREEPVYFGGAKDSELINWATHPHIHILKNTATGWQLCDPLKDFGETQDCTKGMASEEDAEGEEL